MPDLHLTVNSAETALQQMLLQNNPVGLRLAVQDLQIAVYAEIQYSLDRVRASTRAWLHRVSWAEQFLAGERTPGDGAAEEVVRRVIDHGRAFAPLSGKGLEQLALKAATDVQAARSDIRAAIASLRAAEGDWLAVVAAERKAGRTPPCSAREREIYNWLMTQPEGD